MNEQPPNILWIVSEDCPPWFGCFGDELAETPNLDRLAHEGIRYSNAFSPAPVCAPSRFSLLTGVAANSNSPANHMRAVAAVPNWLKSYPELARLQGYYCTNNAKTDYNAQLDEATIWDECGGAAHWRNRAPGQPFLAVFNIDTTHESALFGAFGPAPELLSPADVDVPPYLPDTDEIRQDIANYYGFIAKMDGSVGDLIIQLAEDGLTDDTVIIHTSDHGGVLPRSKRFCNDTGLRVPLIVVPSKSTASLFLPGGSVVEAPVSTLALPPTVVSLTGGTPPPYMSDASLLGRTHDMKNDVAFSFRDRMDERMDTVRSVRSARYRYTRNYTPQRPLIQHQAFAWMAAGWQSFEQARIDGRLSPEQERLWQTKDSVELYDVQADPHEMHNLAGSIELAAVENELAQRLRQHTLRIVDNGFLPEGAAAQGIEASRSPGRYPLAHILDVADRGLSSDEAAAADLIEVLADTDPTARRWAAIGLVRAIGDQRLGTVSVHDLSIALTSCLDDDAAVRVPAAEALARLHVGKEGHTAYRTLVTTATSDESVAIRLEAVNALTWLNLEVVTTFKIEIATVAHSDDPYLRSAGRYLLSVLDGKYVPTYPVFDMKHMIDLAARARN
ncbi:MAG: sulfatase [Rhodococcus erythropolis]|jgi:arylsulfatase A-like enzyme|nr:sulfatase-like hydrolase/transferase [Rhodococcus erythropolis]MDF2894127.1 sulfatase [Rhodococcus erythropolis]